MTRRTEVKADRTELTNNVLDRTCFDVSVGPDGMADNLLAGIHPNNWNKPNSRFLRTRDDSRGYLMAILDVTENPVEHTAKVVENAVRVYYEKGGEAPEKFVAASAAYYITSRFLFQHTVENAIADDLDATTYTPKTHAANVVLEGDAKIDIVTRDTSYQVKTGRGTETDNADKRIYADIHGREIEYEIE